MRPLIKLAGNLIRKNFLPRANNQVLGGREGDFYPEKGEKDLMGREEGILLSAQLSRWKKVSFLCNLYFTFAQYHGKEVRPGTKVVGGRK